MRLKSVPLDWMKDFLKADCIIVFCLFMVLMRKFKLIQANKSMKRVNLEERHDNKISRPYISAIESRNKIKSSEILF